MQVLFADLYSPYIPIPEGRGFTALFGNGSIQRTIKITTRGNYTLAVKNNSAKEVDVSGYVNF